jgi:hypothetical protein
MRVTSETPQLLFKLYSGQRVDAESEDVLLAPLNLTEGDPHPVCAVAHSHGFVITLRALLTYMQ